MTAMDIWLFGSKTIFVAGNFFNVVGLNKEGFAESELNVNNFKIININGKTNATIRSAQDINIQSLDSSFHRKLYNSFTWWFTLVNFIHKRRQIWQPEPFSLIQIVFLLLLVEYKFINLYMLKVKQFLLRIWLNFKLIWNGVYLKPLLQTYYKPSEDQYPNLDFYYKEQYNTFWLQNAPILRFYYKLP